MQELSSEIAKYCQDAIKRKKDVSVKPPNPLSRRLSLQHAINERMASVVEKDDKSSAHLLRSVEENNRPKSIGSMKTAFRLFTKLPNDDGKYDIFLNIRDPDLISNPHQLRLDYIAFKRSDSNVPFIFFTLLCGIFFMVTGMVWSSNVGTFIYFPTVVLTIIFAVLTALSLAWVALNRVAFLSFRYNIVCLQWYHKYVTKLYELSYGQWPDNSTNICAALAAGFYLVNIVLMNICNPEMEVHVGMNNHHACDSFSGPPPESFVFTMVIVLLLQIAARGVSRMALVCSWIICFIAINMTIYLSGSGSYVWMNVLQALIMFVSYELERQPLRQFIKTARAIEAGEMNAKLRVRLAAYETLQAAEALKAKCSLVRSQS